MLHQEEGGGETAERRPGGVDAVEGTQLPAGRGEVAHGETAQGGKGAPHQGRRRQQDQEAQDEARQREHHGPALEQLVEGGVKVVETGQDPREGQREQTDAQLEEGVDPQSAAAAVGDASEEGAAQRQPGHERGENGADGENADSEDDDQHAHPDHLVHEGAGPGKEEQGGDHQRGAPVHRLSPTSGGFMKRPASPGRSGGLPRNPAAPAPPGSNSTGCRRPVRRPSPAVD